VKVCNDNNSGKRRCDDEAGRKPSYPMVGDQVSASADTAVQSRQSKDKKRAIEGKAKALDVDEASLMMTMDG
jgi:hypothetical protein